MKYIRNNKGFSSAAGILCVAIAAVLIAAFAMSITIVPTGHTGVVTTFGKVTGRTFTEGLHFKVPVAQAVSKMDNRVQKAEVDTEAFSKDLQTVTTKLAINYQVVPDKSAELYKTVGKSYEEILITPAVNEVLKSLVALYTAEENVTNREIISQGLVEGLNQKLEARGIKIVSVSIVDFDFSDAYINAIEEKQVAQQQLLTADEEPQKKIKEAEAAAEAVKIAANAEAEANKKISDSITDKILENKKIEKWDGVMPKVTGGNGTIIDIGDITGKQ